VPLQQWLQPSAQAVDYSSSSVKKTAIFYLELRNSGVQRELTEAIQAASQWNWRRWSAALQVMQERPRRRALQTVPERVRLLIADCQARGLSNI